MANSCPPRGGGGVGGGGVGWAVHLYQLRPEVQACGLSMPSSMPSCFTMGASTAAASLGPTPSANSFPDAKAHSAMPRKLKKAMYLHQMAGCPSTKK